MEIIIFFVFSDEVVDCVVEVVVDDEVEDEEVVEVNFLDVMLIGN